MLKKVLAVITAIAIIIGLGHCVLMYLWHYRLTTIDTVTSPDGKYTAVFEEIGEQDGLFGPSHVKVTVKNAENGKNFVTVEDSISNDGGSLNDTNWNVMWNSDTVTITLIGCEQWDKKYTLLVTEQAGLRGFSS